MSTIFPREEKTEQIFDEILKNPHACERLKDTFFEAIPSAEESEGAGTDIPGTVFAAALFTAYENKDLSAFMMAVCNSSVFDLLRNSFLISIRFNDKGVENPIFLTDENGDLLSGSHQHACAKKYKMFHKLYEQQDEVPDYHMYMTDGFREKHGYNEKGEIETFRISEHTGILMLFPQVKAEEGPYVADLPVEPTPTVTMNKRQVPLLEILQELEKQTGIFFSYESSMLDEFQKVSFKAQDESLSYCLRRLFYALPITFRMTGQIIILKRKPRLYTISGFVRDSVSYESLINASVFERNTKSGTTTNNYGFYSVTLPPGKVTLRASFVGYDAKEVTFELSRDTLVDIPLHALGALGEIVVEGLNPRSEVLSTRTGVVEVPSQRIKSMPALLGETDVVKTLQRLPGVAVGVEGMTGLHVRGGNSDGNLYLLDGNPVYHTNHLLGFFSAFNPDAVRNTTFYKGSFPAEYGGRLSSVVDVRTNDGDRYEYHGNFSIGLLALRGNLEGPIIKGKSSFNVSVRRTWMELFTWPILKAVNKDRNNKLKGGYHFFDMNAKVNHSFTDRTRLYLSFYMGSDSYLDGEEFSYGDRLGKDFRWRWGNLYRRKSVKAVFALNYLPALQRDIHVIARTLCRIRRIMPCLPILIMKRCSMRKAITARQWRM